MMNNFSTSRLGHLFQWGIKPVLVGLLVGLSASFGAENSKDQPKHEVSDKVSEALGGPIKTAKEAKNWEEVIRQLDVLLTASAPASYERAVLSVEKAQTIFQTNDLSRGLEPLEQALQLSDQYNYFDHNTTLTMVLTLAQLYAQDAQSSKKPEEQRQLYAKAYTYVRRWLDQSNAANPDLQQFAASILLQQAQLNPDKVDMGLVKQAQVETEKGLRMSIKPKEQFYILLLATLQQQGDYKRSAEVLELMVVQNPKNKTYWPLLAATYLQLEENVRAIITIERAQQYGMMVKKKDNYTLVGIYYNIKQYDRTTELLKAGLHNGTIENEQKNWELLAAAYQQMHKEAQAIDVLKEGSKNFPKSGALDLMIGQMYYALDKIPDAYVFLKSALQKGVEKPGQTYMLLGYFAFELKKLDEAVDALEKAVKADPNSKDAQRLLLQFKESLKERDAQKTQPSL